MTNVNTAEAKAHLSRLLKRVKAGETIVICERNVPVAELRPLRTQMAKRPIGPAVAGFHVPDLFFEPLPEDILRGFEGQET